MKTFGNFASAVTLTIAILVAGTDGVESKPLEKGLKFETNTQTIQGQSGGPIDSKGCGFIANTPNYVINLPQRLDYMRLSVQTNGGEPTLLVIGPNSGDSLCALGDRVSGFKPEISGVWEPGEYQIFIGDRTGSNYQFTLNISTK
jgi:hypothetical protein